MSNLLKGWKETVLSEIIDTKIDNRGRNPERYSDCGIPVIDNYLITGNRHIDLDSIRRYVDQEIYENFIRNYLNENDVLITLVGNGYGNVSLAPSKTSVIIQNTIGLRCDNSNDNIFLYYYLKNSKKKLELMDIGAAQPSIKVGTLLDMKLIIPESPDEQKAIANILSSLDKKIELLKEQNKTLETMAQTVFKEWFVNFNYPDATGEMVESEMGEIPKGWRVGRLGEVTNIKGGTTPSTTIKEFWNGEICWSSPKDLSNYDFVFLLDTNKKITLKGLEKISSGLLPKGTLLLSSRAPIGYLAISNVDIAINQGYIALLNDAIFSNHFMYLWLKINLNLVINSANGSTFLEISKSSFKNIKCLIPSKNVLDDFNSVVKTLFEKLLVNSQQIRTLENLCDTLLPRLMSGKHRVDEYDA